MRGIPREEGGGREKKEGREGRRSKLEAQKSQARRRDKLHFLCLVTKILGKKVGD